MVVYILTVRLGEEPGLWIRVMLQCVIVNSVREGNCEGNQESAGVVELL